MENYQVSKLHIFSYGTVAEDKPIGDKKVKVTPDESMLMLDGEVTSHAAQNTVKGYNQDGSAYSVNSITSNVIIANWLPFADGQRVNSPDVRRGERVAIYQFGDEQNYYWTTLGLDLHLRKLETVVYAFSGTRDESAGVSAENYYFFEISTHKKLVHFHTSQADGEPVGWDVQFDTGRGIFTLTDTLGNHYQLDALNHLMTFKNASDTVIELNKTDLNITVPGNTTINTKGNTTINTQGNASIETTGTNRIVGSRNIMIGPLSLSVGTSSEGNTVTGTIHIDDATIDQLRVNSIIQAPGINGPSTGVF